MWQVCPSAENLPQLEGQGLDGLVSRIPRTRGTFIQTIRKTISPAPPVERLRRNDLPDSLDEPSSEAPHEYHEATQDLPVTCQLLTSGVLPLSAA